MLKLLKKTSNVAGAFGTLIGDTITACSDSTGIIKEKVISSLQEEKLEQATNRVLLKAECVKKVMDTLNCDWKTACSILKDELNKTEN